MTPPLGTPSDVRRGTTDDPFRFGWRDVIGMASDGRPQRVRVPLTEQDVLHPQEDDQPMVHPHHVDDTEYLRQALIVYFRDRLDVLILHDCRTDWQVVGIEPLGPDIVVFDHAEPYSAPEATLKVLDRGYRTLTVIEVTSPSTRNGDIGAKVSLYEACGVPCYVIADVDYTDAGRQVTLLGYRQNSHGYEPMSLNEDGRLWLAELGLWLGVRDGFVVLYTPEGRALERYLETHARADEAEAQAAIERERADEAEAQMQEERQRAEDAERLARDEHRRADDAERLARDERQRAEDAKRAAEDAERAAEDVERLAREERQRWDAEKAELLRRLAALSSPPAEGLA